MPTHPMTHQIFVQILITYGADGMDDAWHWLQLMRSGCVVRIPG